MVLWYYTVVQSKGAEDLGCHKLMSMAARTLLSINHDVYHTCGIYFSAYAMIRGW